MVNDTEVVNDFIVSCSNDGNLPVLIFLHDFPKRYWCYSLKPSGDVVLKKFQYSGYPNGVTVTFNIDTPTLILDVINVSFQSIPERQFIWLNPGLFTETDLSK